MLDSWKQMGMGSRMDDMEERFRKMEGVLAQLQRHVELQDKEMFMLSERVRLIERELKQARERLALLGEGGGGLPANEKPPHY